MGCLYRLTDPNMSSLVKEGKDIEKFLGDGNSNKISWGHPFF